MEGSTVCCLACPCHPFRLAILLPFAFCAADLRCWAFNPPGGLLSWNLSQIAQSFCTRWGGQGARGVTGACCSALCASSHLAEWRPIWVPHCIASRLPLCSRPQLAAWWWARMSSPASPSPPPSAWWTRWCSAWPGGRTNQPLAASVGCQRRQIWCWLALLPCFH